MRVIIEAGDPNRIDFRPSISHYFPECYCKHPKQHIKYVETSVLILNKDTQFIATNSEHIINRLRIAHKKGEIELVIHWYDFEKDLVEVIRVDKKGELEKYPKGLLDEWSNQLIELI